MPASAGMTMIVEDYDLKYAVTPAKAVPFGFLS
jgi:hypothetical protein